MAGVMVPKRTTVAADVGFGVCVWRLPDGSFIKDESGSYFCVQGPVGNANLEIRMRDAVRGLGVKSGGPIWFPGFRKITDGEWEDQYAAFLEGRTPDAVDLYLQSEGKA